MLYSVFREAALSIGAIVRRYIGIVITRKTVIVGRNISENSHVVGLSITYYRFYSHHMKK
jgi:hypothetical protein